MAKENSSRTRNFATVVYPESAPENWIDILSDLRIPAFISPLHDKDVNPSGESKKAHHHVMIMFEGVKTLEQACDVFGKIGGVGLERVQSVRGYARYMCHLDNPEKAQYDVDKVRCLSGADYYDKCTLVTDKYKAIGDIIDFCECNNVFSYSDLLCYARSNKPEWFRVMCDNGSYVIDKYLKSRTWTFENPTYAGVGVSDPEREVHCNE